MLPPFVRPRYLPLRRAPLLISYLPPRRGRSLVPRPVVAPTAARMSGGCGSSGDCPGNPRRNPKVSRLQSLMTENSRGRVAVTEDNSDGCSPEPRVACGWEKSWVEGVTPWDLGQPTPVVLHLLQTGDLPKGRALVPGCGSGHDVVAMASPERYVIGLDISESAVKVARELASTSWNKKHFTFLAVDFFTWQPAELFDLVFDYTFFCAIDPSLRSAWAKKVGDVLKQEGELITLIFPADDYPGGPPYAVPVKAYEEVLTPLGFKAVSMIDNELAIEPRKGREKLARWRREFTPSLL